MHHNPVSRIEALAKASRLLGVSSISIPLISLVFLYFFRDEGGAGRNVNLILYQALKYSGLIFGLAGYILYLIVQRRIRLAKVEDQTAGILSTARTLSMIGILITLLFLCTALNSGFAY